MPRSYLLFFHFLFVLASKQPAHSANNCNDRERRPDGYSSCATISFNFPPGLLCCLILTILYGICPFHFLVFYVPPDIMQCIFSLIQAANNTLLQKYAHRVKVIFYACLQTVDHHYLRTPNNNYLYTFRVWGHLSPFSKWQPYHLHNVCRKRTVSSDVIAISISTCIVGLPLTIVTSRFEQWQVIDTVFIVKLAMRHDFLWKCRERASLYCHACIHISYIFPSVPHTQLWQGHHLKKQTIWYGSDIWSL